MTRPQREPIRDPVVLERASALLDLFEVAVELVRQNHRRTHPADPPERIEERVLEWLAATPWPDSPRRIRDRIESPSA